MHTSPSHRRSLIVFAAIVGIGVAILIAISSHESDSKVQWLAGPPQSLRPKLAFLGPWANPVRMQLLRFKQWMFGPARLIDVDAVILELSPAAASNLLARSLALTDRADGRVFVIKDSNAFRDELLMKESSQKPTNNVLSRPRVTVADGMQAQFASYETKWVGASNLQKGEVGWWMDVFPRARGRFVDLDCFMTQTGLELRHNVGPPDAELTDLVFVRTNVSVGVRAHIPEKGGLFLLSPSTNRNGYAVGALLSPTVQKKAGR